MAVSFISRRKEQELVTPARSTPHEYKALSNIDDQHGLRYYPAGVEFFRCRRGTGIPSARDIADEPVGIIRVALAEALVSYYPLAGCLVELPVAGGKLLVDCTAEGVVFVEADAEVRVDDLAGQTLTQPYPCVEELLCSDIGEPQDAVVGKPLLFFQVTRFLNSDGFAIGYRYCHSIIDGLGMAQLLDDIYRLARGEMLTIQPVWGRELLTSLSPPCITHKHGAYDPLPAATSAPATDIILKTPLEHMVTRYFHFGLQEMAAIRSQVPASLRRSTTTFELAAAAFWRCRTAALEYSLNQQVRLMIWTNARWSWKPRSPLPEGFYGNALIPLTVEASVHELCHNPLSHVVDLVRNAKIAVTDDYMWSLLNFHAQHGRPFRSLEWTYVIGDTTGLSRRAMVNLGRWERAGGGISTTGRVVATSFQSYYDRCKCKRGDGKEFVTVSMSMCLPPAAMDRFAKLITTWSHESLMMSAM
ncbi:hypothetical protein PR202_gb16246 [Eleusine coracana subsp. coracana]|uniref:Uncharacterized protein n=1 Tax=Eleusine coracana subsp. coracana TaxID=191504 RepID=A0AAV5F1N9_ELECO|nr:hypothetical protein QOZ80_9BG0700890 [Eleusine coracana subsp. coracana]GJN28156.1 hypothetical protein PR202_gb16246 [Eleusine coracana subsp. coracana]